MSDFMNHMNWIEDLPANCPPGDAIQPNNNEFYRLVNSNPPTPDDFLSYRQLWPNKLFNKSECIVRSISIFSNVENILRVKKLTTQKDKFIAKIVLQKKDGVIKQTCADQAHYSWWRTRGFDLNQCELM